MDGWARRIVAAAWIFFILFLAVTFFLAWRRILHASFLFMAVPLVMTFLCSLSAILIGGWRVCRGPRRWLAAAWSILGLLPALLVVTGGAYLITYLAYLHSPRDSFLPIVAFEPLFELVIEPYVLIHYPHRCEGERFVMWSESPNADAEEMAAMDSHIKAMEKTLGRRSDYKVYWVRGSVFGISGLYMYGWAIGSPPKAPGKSFERLDYLDRHEVAHFALDQSRTSLTRMSMLLHEGWAQRCSSEPNQNHPQSLPYSLKELTASRFYDASRQPMYEQGSVLVEYVVRNYGGEKFLELFTTCRQETFDADVRRVLGVSLDELDQAYRKAVIESQRQNGRASDQDEAEFLRLKIGKGVDSAEWKALCEKIVQGRRSFLDQFQEISLSAKTTVVTEKDGVKTEERGETEMKRSDGRQVAVERFEKRSMLSIWTHDIFCVAEAEIDSKDFHFLDYWSRNELNYLQPRNYCNQENLIEAYGFFYSGPNPKTVTGAGVSPIVPSWIRISYEVTNPSNKDEVIENGWFDVDPALNYAVKRSRREYIPSKSATAKKDDSMHVRSEESSLEYESKDGITLPISLRLKTIMSNGNTIDYTWEIVSCKVEPSPKEAFELKTYGVSNPPRRDAGGERTRAVAVCVAAVGVLLGFFAAGGLLRSALKSRPA